MGRSVDSRDEMRAAAISARPPSASRPADHSTERPCVDRPSSPSSCRVFQGVPSPASTAAGHIDTPSDTVMRALPKPSAARSCKGAVVQQSAPMRALMPLKAGRSCHCSRPGRAAASLLPSPPVSTRRAVPFHTVPRASASSTLPWLARCTAPASQRAGANSTRASSTPASRPPTAQPQGAPGRWPGRMGGLCRATAVTGPGAPAGSSPACRPTGRRRCASGALQPAGRVRSLGPGSATGPGCRARRRSA
jgi:hypothetical protein